MNRTGGHGGFRPGKGDGAGGSVPRYSPGVWSGPVTLSAGTTMTVPPVAGWMRFGWPSGGIAEVGTCPAELNATWPGSRLQTVPNPGYQVVQFPKTLA